MKNDLTGVKRGIVGIILLFNGMLLTSCGSGGGGPGTSQPQSLSPQPNSNTLFSAPKLLSNASGDSEGPLLGLDATGAVSVAWLEKVLASGGVGEHEELYQTKVLSRGDILFAAKSLWPDHPFSKPRMVVGQTNTYDAWLTPPSVTPDIPEVFVTNSASTASPTYLSDISEIPTPLPAWNVDLGLDKAEQIYVAWSEGPMDARKIYVRKSSDTGGNFIFKHRVSNPAIDSDEPHLVAEGAGIANVVWVEHPGGSERHIGFARTENSSSSFSDPISLSPDGVDAQCPQVGTDGSGRLYVAWTGTDLGGKTQIHLSTSTDHLTFTEAIPPMGQNQTGCPQLVVRRGGGAYLVWEEAGEIYFTRFLAGKKGWIEPVNVSRSSGSPSASPQIALDNLAINVVWEDEAGGTRQIYFAGSKSGGASFSIPVNLSQSSEEAISPALQSNGKGQVVVAWAQGAPGAKNIYLQIGSGARGLPTPFESGTAPNRDVNQDGIDDFIVGAPADQSGTPGKAYLFFGKSAMNSTPDMTFHGFNPDDRFGAAVSLGDINGDGVADVFVGAPETDNGRGAVYIYFGPFGPVPHPDQADLVIEGVQGGGRLGVSLSSAGDIDGDGSEDLITGAPSATGRVNAEGQVYLFLGGDPLKTKSNSNDPSLIQATDADQVYSGEEPYSQFGVSVAGIGDLNGDGLADFAVGAPYENDNHGGVHLFYGGADPPTTPEAIITGLHSGDSFGISMSGSGDVDGDGYDDFIVGTDSETATLFFGGDPLDISHALTLANPETDPIGFGVTVGGRGDVNGDGFDDILIGAPFYAIPANGGKLYVGKVFLYLGSTLMNGTADRVFVGEHGSYQLGYGATRLSGDVNNDGQDDILLGASLWDDPTQAGKTDQGKAYLFMGSKDWIETGGTTPIVPANSADIQLTGQSSKEHFGGAVWRERAISPR